MIPKDARSRWLAGLLLISAIALGIAIYQVEIKGSPNDATAPGPIGHELDNNAANGLDSPPTAGASAPAPFNPLAFLINNRQRNRGSAEQGNVQLDPNEPARVLAEMPPVAAAPGSPSQFGD